MNAPNGAPRAPPASRALAAASLAAFAGALDRAAFASVIESLRADLWLTDARLGGLAAAAVLASVTLAPFFARLAARRPPGRILALGAALGAAGAALSGAARRGLALLAARVAAGAGAAARAGAAPALGAPEGGAGLAVAGAAAGYALGALASRAVGWRWALVAAGAPALLAAVAALRLGRARAGTPADPPAEPGGDGLRAELRRLRADRPRLLAVAGQAGAAFAAAALAFWTPAFLERARGVPRAAAGVGFAVVVLAAGLAGSLAGGRAVERLRARTPAAERWVAGVAALAAAPLALAAFVAWRPRAYLPALVLAQLLLFAAARAGAAAVAAAVAAATPPGGAGRAAAAAALAVAVLAEAPAPALVGLLSDRTSLGRALAILVPLSLALGGGAWLAAARRAGRGAGRGA